MAMHAPDQPERSHPLAWTVGLLTIIALLTLWFGHWLRAGQADGRDIGPIKIPQPAGAVAVDHEKLIADRSPEVIAKGKALFAQNCALCHGPQGRGDGPGAVGGLHPRNFHVEPFKNVNGGGPYGIFYTLENGFTGASGQMPPFASLPAADKYALAHFIRETWVKTDNPANYVENDPPEVQAKIPKAGAGGEGGGPEIPPAMRPVTVPVLPLLSAEAAQARDDAQAADAWIVAVAQHAEPPFRAALAQLVDKRGSGSLTMLYRAARAGDTARIAALLARGDSALYTPAASVMTQTEVAALARQLTTGAGAPAQKGAE